MILFGRGANLKMDLERVVAWSVARLVGAMGSIPAADARDVRLLGGGRRDTRDTFAVVLRDAGDSDPSEMETREELWNDMIVDAD